MDMPRLAATLPPTLDAPGRAEALAALCERYGVRSLALFGSAVSEDRFDPARSDVDLLVEFDPERGPGLTGYFDLKDALEALFGRPVDIVAPKRLRNPYFRSAALASMRHLYGSALTVPA